ncbi:FAD/NAD(P)-binding domain-containing protein [Bimuria novae-zelandiae CBS 107.79]|uniref:FAD/NAD(P)-binding domain-containing protein n=1 Tax=Bimuria novae-zelandiae CBS 107.79 TaxID=1447943 RepID=A0A6A5VKQ5_9PLEO|nr:FAD/NAD(P)-binding domain-containing protein [Bimuria novae-zelandiae CBS 107.79]
MSAVPSLPEETPLVTTNGDSNGGTNGIHSYQLRDEPIENFRPLKVIVIGAGYSGIYHSIRIPERLRNVELVVYEKNAGVGGTWYENRYLGCACDIPSHSYQYTFEPNRDWSSLYAPAREIQAYLEQTAKKYSADRFIKLSHEVTECRWDDAIAKWNIAVKNLTTGEIINDQSDVLISARGNLNTPAWPKIEGLETFKGEVMHSARWNEDYDFTNKRIGVIGAGSSSIQIVPSLQQLPGTHVSAFVRSKTWISPPFGHSLWGKYGFDGFTIPPELRKRFAEDSEYYAKFRLAVEEDGNGIHAVTIRGTPLQLGAKKLFEESMKKRLESKPHIFDSLLPSFSPGCRRLTPGPGYLEALTQPNVAFVTSRITKISEHAIHTVDGSTHEIDALVCATGFHANTSPPFPITGLHNLSLAEKWSGRPSNYLSHSLSSFPNFFVMLGANSAVGSGSLTCMIENVGDYIIKAIRKLQKEDIAYMVVKKEREEDFAEYVDEYFKGTVFAEECSSWYKCKEGKVVGLWPGSTLHCIEAMRSPRWEDYEYVYREELGAVSGLEALEERGSAARRRANQLKWLGNGFSVNEKEGRDLAWYLYRDFLNPNVPVAPRPEEHGMYSVRAFSY